MSISEETAKALQNLGLTEYETKAYVTLLQRGAMTARETSEISLVPYSKIYEVLGSLEKKGWIETESGRPSKHYPRSPLDALETTRLKRESLLQAKESQILRELTPLFEKRESQERPDIWIVRGEFNILSKIRETIGRSTSEILIALPVLPKEMLNLLAPTLAHIKSQGITIQFMISKDVDKEILEQIADFAEVRIRRQMFGGGIVSDVHEVILVLEEEKGGTALAIWSDHVGLARFAKNYFEYLWHDAKDKIPDAVRSK
jgi:sugar-specific transcriptional regulator TrmB